MRPRVSQREAQIILDCLEVTRDQLEQKLTRYEQLKKEIPELQRRIRVEGIILFRDSHFKDKKLELEKLKQEFSAITDFLRIHDKLIKKYKAIAEGCVHRGTYKSASIKSGFIVYPEEKLRQVILS